MIFRKHSLKLFSLLIVAGISTTSSAVIVLGTEQGPLQNSPISPQANDFDDPRVCFEITSGSVFEGLAQVFLEVGINEPGVDEQIDFSALVEVYNGDPTGSGVIVDTSGTVNFPNFNLGGPTSGQTDYTIPVSLGMANPLMAGHFLCGTVITTGQGGPGMNPDVWDFAQANASVPEPGAFALIGFVGMVFGIGSWVEKRRTLK